VPEDLHEASSILMAQWILHITVQN